MGMHLLIQIKSKRLAEKIKKTEKYSDGESREGVGADTPSDLFTLIFLQRKMGGGGEREKNGV